MNLEKNLLREIAEELEQDQESARVKKLIYYACKNTWESDPNVLDSYPLENLIEELYQLAPSIEQLNTFIYQVADTLNRPDVYSKVANLIISQVSLLYEDEEVYTQVMYPENPRKDDDDYEYDDLISPELLEQIFNNIEYHEEVVRLKKLLFATCKHYWENEIEEIENYDLRDILLETRSIYTSRENLKRGIENVISTLNRQNFYRFIADTIISELSVLYDEEEEELDTKLVTQQIISIEHQIKEVATQTENKNFFENNERKTKSYNFFELKQEIMQYTNPLVAKILLFYTVYQLDSSEHHWSIVRTCSLDDLLIKLFLNYNSLEEIESQLNTSASSPIEHIEIDDNRQAASAIFKAVKHFVGKN